MAIENIHNDQPTNGDNEDTLNRDKLAQEIVCFIEKNNAALTLGVHGDWGSGKTSFINKIKHKLEEQNSDKKFKCITFEAWRYQYEPEPLAVLLQQIKKQNGKTCWEKFYDNFQSNWDDLCNSTRPYYSRLNNNSCPTLTNLLKKRASVFIIISILFLFSFNFLWGLISGCLILSLLLELAKIKPLIDFILVKIEAIQKLYMLDRLKSDISHNSLNDVIKSFKEKNEGSI